MDVPLGSSVLMVNISEKGGDVWKVHVDKNLLLDTFPRVVSSLCPGAQRSGVLRPRWVVHANPPPPGGFSLLSTVSSAGKRHSPRLTSKLPPTTPLTSAISC